MVNNNNNSSLIKKKFLKELISRQIKSVQPHRRLLQKDMNRIVGYIESSIFDEKKCCLWNGYVTNADHDKKGTYVNFFFRNKKVALHRLLYENFVGELSDDHYLKYTCPCKNKGRCCNINHMVKYEYHYIKNNENSETNKNTKDNSNPIISDNYLKITFD